jgi:hypothetical protein
MVETSAPGKEAGETAVRAVRALPRRRESVVRGLVSAVRSTSAPGDPRDHLVDGAEDPREDIGSIALAGEDCGAALGLRLLRRRRGG